MRNKGILQELTARPASNRQRSIFGAFQELLPSHSILHGFNRNIKRVGANPPFAIPVNHKLEMNRNAKYNHLLNSYADRNVICQPLTWGVYDFILGSNIR